MQSVNIDEYTRVYRFTPGMKDRVHDMVQHYGVLMVLGIFEQMDELPLEATESGIQQFQRLSENAIRDYRQRQEQSAFEARWNESHDATERAHAKGYKPSHEAIRTQLDQLYEDGEISAQQYEWGLKGLDMVFDLVGVPEQETADLPF